MLSMSSISYPELVCDVPIVYNLVEVYENEEDQAVSLEK